VGVEVGVEVLVTQLTRPLGSQTVFGIGVKVELGHCGWFGEGASKQAAGPWQQ